jgi:hypothetical protein
MNALSESASAEQALVEASDAHLILFTETQARSLPFWVYDWLDRWAADRALHDAAVGIIKRENARNFQTPSFPELSRFAREHGLSFIVDEDQPAKNPEALPVRFPTEMEVGLPASEICFADLATRSCYRGFGINE